MSEKEIIGHEASLGHLVSAIEAGKVSHAVILNGEDGMGKRFIAEYYAKLLLCKDRISDANAPKHMSLRPCGHCASCLQAESGNNPDIIFVTHEKPRIISVDEIRSQVVDTVSTFPYAGEYKIYIIDEAEKMNEQAMNALLKTIEEPPAFVVILLLTDNKERLLPTIRSRCEIIDVKPVNTELIKNYLMKEYKLPDYAAESAARFASGNIGRAERFAADKDFNAMKDSVLSVMRSLDKNGAAEAVEASRKFADFKDHTRDLIDLAELWFHDMLVLKATGDANRLIFKDDYSILRDQAAKRNYDVIERAVDICERTKKRLDANVNFDTAMELMFLHLKDFS